MAGPVLQLLSPGGQRTSIVLDRSPVLIGRQPDNHVILRDNRASRQHARISREGGQWILEDLASRHGTWINGVRITRQTLEHGDRIEFGVDEGYQITFLNDTPTLSGLIDRFSKASDSTRESGGTSDLGRLRAMVEVARSLQHALSLDEVLETVVGASLAITGCERGFLLLRGPAGLTVAAARNGAGERLAADDLRVPMGLIERALNSRREMLSMHFDPLDGQNLDLSVAQLELRSVICVPLVRLRGGASDQTWLLSSSRDTAGLLYLDSRAAHADLSQGNRELVHSLALEISTILENARLLDQDRERRKMEEELSIARGIQLGLLPRNLPGEGWFRAAGSSEPTHQVGGDYFDVVKLDPGAWSFTIADVSGKGVSSALLATFLQGAFLDASRMARPMSEHLARINAYLIERANQERYATVFHAVVHRNGRLVYSNAGHCAPLLVGADGVVQTLEASALPVGLIDEAEFGCAEVGMKPGDVLVAFSDGVTEARNAEGEFFEKARLERAAAGAAGQGAAAVHQAIKAALDAFVRGVAQPDDLTLLCVEYQNPV